jgi:Bifunctional DNA primase/polymerase, N-terminal
VITLEQLTQLNRQARANGTILDLIGIAGEHKMSLGDIFDLQQLAFTQIAKEEQEKSVTSVQMSVTVKSDGDTETIDLDAGSPQVTVSETTAPVSEIPKTAEGPMVDAVVGEIQKPNVTFFESIAQPLLARGFKVAPCFPKKKQVHGGLVPRPLEMISDNPAQIHAWGLAEPEANICVYAKQEEGGLLFLDKDGAVSLREKYERETGKAFPKTLLVRSSLVNGSNIAKGHWYFRQTPKTIALEGNISEDSTDGLFSLRVHNQYVCSIGSVHPITGLPYEVAEDNPVLPMPDDLLAWLQAQVVQKPKTRKEVIERGKFGKGTRYPALISEAGRLWQRGYSAEDVIDVATKWARENFDVPEGAFDESLVRGEVKRIVDTYPQGDPASETFVVNGNTIGTAAAMSEPTEEQKKESGEHRLEFSEDTEVIPAFDPSVVNGIYARFVELMTRGTTLVPQYAFLAAKTYIGLRIAGRVKFATVDAQPRYFGVAIGETGSGKGAA